MRVNILGFATRLNVDHKIRNNLLKKNVNGIERMQIVSLLKDC